ncbi:hypothetical protein BAU15_11140 [Enterococcus sp. JM4C]|uniref:CsbD family protein n=1 Tax=Candidatus Enterococcus huntleyi TaxID=1857217 RepID=UPI00137B249D|nr:CsbD family protein [Enterococcus sp. JM4C]KAF1298673.1 hypothetical protein BAU15_11140 [Enterococcus sp. JM4C]
MSGMKEQSDKLVGSVKEKMGDLLNNPQLKESGKEQADQATELIQKKKERLKELEDSYDELAAQKQDLTKAQIETPEEDQNPTEHVSQAPHISPKQEREEIRMKHYTGIEEK